MTGAGVPTGQLPRGSESPKLNPPSAQHPSNNFTSTIASFYSFNTEVPFICFLKAISAQTQCQSGRSGAPFRTGSYFPLATTPFIEKSKNKFTSTIASLYLFNSRCALRPFFQSRFRSNPAPVAALCERRRAIPHWRPQTCVCNFSSSIFQPRSGLAAPQNPPAKPRNREGFLKPLAGTQEEES